jgi:hypothetical protein
MTHKEIAGEKSWGRLALLLADLLSICCYWSVDNNSVGSIGMRISSVAR